MTDPEPFGIGNAIVPSSPVDQRDQHELLAAELRGNAHRHASPRPSRPRPAAGRPCARITGATKAWKVKIAEVGKPGSTAIGLPCATARHSGLPGFSATPCTITPGLPSRDTMRYDRSPAPFEVPPESTTMSHSASAARTAADSAASSSGNAPIADRLAASLRDRGGDDRAVRVIDRAGPQQRCRARRFRRRSREPRRVGAAPRRPARSRRPPACRSRATRYARRGAAASRRVRCRSPHRRRTGPATTVRRRSIAGAAAVDQLRMLDHHDGIGAARDHAAGRDRGRGAGRDGDLAALDRRRAPRH